VQAETSLAFIARVTSMRNAMACNRKQKERMEELKSVDLFMSGDRVPLGHHGASARMARLFTPSGHRVSREHLGCDTLSLYALLVSSHNVAEYEFISGDESRPIA
jgi:hypothetical protein